MSKNNILPDYFEFKTPATEFKMRRLLGAPPIRVYRCWGIDEQEVDCTTSGAVWDEQDILSRFEGLFRWTFINGYGFVSDSPRVPDQFKFTTRYSGVTQTVFTAELSSEADVYNIDWQHGHMVQPQHTKYSRNEVESAISSGNWTIQVDQPRLTVSELVAVVKADIVAKEQTDQGFDRKLEVTINGTTYRAFDKEAEELLATWRELKVAEKWVEECQGRLNDSQTTLKAAEESFGRFKIV